MQAEADGPNRSAAARNSPPSADLGAGVRAEDGGRRGRRAPPARGNWARPSSAIGAGACARPGVAATGACARPGVAAAGACAQPSGATDAGAWARRGSGGG